jgi:hypothetical protein
MYLYNHRYIPVIVSNTPMVLSVLAENIVSPSCDSKTIISTGTHGKNAQIITFLKSGLELLYPDSLQLSCYIRIHVN